MKTLNDFYRLFPSRPSNLAADASSYFAALATAAVEAPANDDVAPAAPRYRERDYGTGYGRSSGYAFERSYTAGRGDRMLRVG